MVAGSGVPEVRVGIGGNPCRRGRLRRGGACGCHLTFREGVGGYPSSRLVVYRGKPLAAASSSSRPFLEVLFGTGASESRSLVGDLRWVQRPRGFLFLCRSAVVGVCFSCIFSFISFRRGCAAFTPAPIIGCLGWLLCIQSGGKPFFGNMDGKA